MKTAKQNFDLQGLEAQRITRQNIVIKFVPIWVTKETPGVAPLLDLLIRHHLGYPIAFITEKYQKHWFKLLTLWRRAVQKLHNYDSKDKVT